MVHLKDVTMRYRSSGTLAANNLSLDIEEGEAARRRCSAGG